MAMDLRRWTTAALLAITFGIAGGQQAAEASFKLRIIFQDANSNTTQYDITDGQTGVDTSTATGQIRFTAPSTYGFTTSITTGRSKPIVGDGVTTSQLTIDTVDVSSAGAGKVTILLIDDNFNFPGNQFSSNLKMTSKVNTQAGKAATAGVSFTFKSFADNGNNDVFSQVGTTPGLQGPFTGAVVAATTPNATKQTTFARNSPYYSMMNVTTITFAGAGSVGITGSTTVQALEGSNEVVPEPSTLALAAAGLPLLALGARRRRRARRAD